jgi:hypothetical protein
VGLRAGLDSQNNNIRDVYSGINEPKKCYQPRPYIVRDGNNDQFPEFHNILIKWKNYFCQLLNAHGFNDARQTKMHTDEPLVPALSSSDL